MFRNCSNVFLRTKSVIKNYVRAIATKCQLNHTFSLSIYTIKNYVRTTSAKQKFKHAFLVSTATALSCYLGQNIYLNRQMKKNKVIPIIHKYKFGVIRRFLGLDEQEHIDSTTLLQFSKNYSQYKETDDINIVIQTVGGTATETDAICNFILNHKGRVTCYIPNYAYSGGLQIALSCHEIVVTNNSSMTPCDVVSKAVPSAYRLLLALSDINLQYRPGLRLNKIIAEDQLEQGKRFLNRVWNVRRYDPELKEKVFVTLFSGYYSHSQFMSATDIKALGLPITIVDVMPKFVDQSLKLYL